MPRFYNCSCSRNNEPFVKKLLGTKTVGMRCDEVLFTIDEVLEILKMFEKDKNRTLRYLISTKCTERPKSDTE